MPAMQKRRTVAVLFGGRSSEHAVSVATAGGVLAAIDRTRFDVVPLGVGADGRITTQPDDPQRFSLRDGKLPELAAGGAEVLWPDSAESRTLRTIDAAGRVTAYADVDVVLPLLHGPFGEDGTMQGLLELAGLPYVGSGVLASAAAMDKEFTKRVLAIAGLRVSRGITVTAADWHRDPSDVVQRVDPLGLPVFVKPARAGSSVGVTRVDDSQRLGDALAVAFQEDSKALVESAVTGREIELGVLGSLAGSGTRVSAVAGEILVSDGGFYDFDAKYLDNGAAKTVCPADVTDAQLAALRDAAARAFEALECRGLARVDTFLTDDGVIVNEVNTIPGFTPISMFPMVWASSGLDYTSLISDLLDQALESSGDGPRGGR